MLLPVNAAMMDACVLATLDKEDTYGYRITQQLSQGLGVSESSLYPVLRRLQKDGCLTTYDVAITGSRRGGGRCLPPTRRSGWSTSDALMKSLSKVRRRMNHDAQ